MYAHEIEHRTTGVAFGNGTPGGVPADPPGSGGVRDECPGAVPGEPTVRADAPTGDDAPRATRAGGTAHV